MYICIYIWKSHIYDYICVSRDRWLNICLLFKPAEHPANMDNRWYYDFYVQTFWSVQQPLYLWLIAWLMACVDAINCILCYIPEITHHQMYFVWYNYPIKYARFPRHCGLAIPCRVVSWCIPGSLTYSFLWGWLGVGGRSRHSRRIHNPQFYVSGRRPI